MDSHWEKCIYQLNSRCLIEHDYDYSKLFLLLAPLLLLLLLLFFVVVLAAPPLVNLSSKQRENAVAGIIIVSKVIWQPCIEVCKWARGTPFSCPFLAIEYLEMCFISAVFFPFFFGKGGARDKTRMFRESSNWK